MIETLSQAPDFTLPVVGGGYAEDATVSLAGLSGTPFVLFFYPRDNTSGCTKEAIGFSELLPEFEAAGVKVFGVSKDTAASHGKFVAKQNLTVPLLTDAEGSLCEDMGVWAEKKMYGKTFMGIVRSTALIDADGKIVQTWPKVKVDGHAAEVLEAAKAL